MLEWALAASASRRRRWSVKGSQAVTNPARGTGEGTALGQSVAPPPDLPAKDARTFDLGVRPLSLQQLLAALSCLFALYPQSPSQSARWPRRGGDGTAGTLGSQVRWV